MAEQTLDISWRAIIKVLIAGFILYVLFVSREVVIWFFFALIISLLLQPVINFLRWLKFPKFLAVILVYLSIFGILGLIIYLTAPIFIFEINQFSQNIPDYFAKISPILNDLGIQVAQTFDDFTATLLSNLQESSKSIFVAIGHFFGGVYSAVLIFTLAFFISLEEDGTKQIVAFLSPKKYEERVVGLFERAQFKVSRWFGARIISCIFVAVASFIVFYLFDVKYAFILALISGALNFVPYVGPTITLGFSMMFAGISNGWVVAVYICVALLAIQEIENKVITPLLMKKFMDLPPVLVLIALLIGGILFGFLGTIFAVPIFGIIYEFTKEFLEKRKEEQINAA